MEKVAGQGVSGAYRELVRLLHRDAKDQLIVTENLPIGGRCDSLFIQLISPIIYRHSRKTLREGKLAMCTSLPDTLEGSLKIPFS